ncbi:MAG: glycine cleavage system protein GcvH [Gammaproteobacteria bacterium]|nr:glycine cleavage system protein GcvH [Gammaproteobacteria bacterium]
MNMAPKNLKYSDSHEWVKVDASGVATIGITDHAQELLGDLVYVELPEVGIELNAADEAGVVESVKAASDVYTPVSGKVVAVNQSLDSNPELVNSDPYTEGWLFKIQLSDKSELESLMTSEEYVSAIEAEDEEYDYDDEDEELLEDDGFEDEEEDE